MMDREDVYRSLIRELVLTTHVEGSVCELGQHHLASPATILKYTFEVGGVRVSGYACPTHKDDEWRAMIDKHIDALDTQPHGAVR